MRFTTCIQIITGSVSLVLAGFPGLLDATLDDLRHGLDSGAFTSVDLVNAYIARIKETNDDLRAVIEINPDALHIASQLDKDLHRHGAYRGPLHGIPILVKDNIATDDEMNNTAGSYALLGAKVPEDSTVVDKLRKAGAIILGKTNLSQWASFRGVNSTNGWSAYGGQTVGAYYEGHDPSGSSSGSAVASSLGLAWASLGTETAGSIIHPSHMNNLVGIKPTVGLTSRHLVVPITLRQDTVGPLARTVKDAAALLSAIVGPDGKDNYTDAIPWNEPPDYVAACRLDGLDGMRIGVARQLMELNDTSGDAALPAFEDALEILKSLGAEIIDDITFRMDSLYDLMPTAAIIGGLEFLHQLPTTYLDLLEVNPHNITNLSQLREFTQNEPKEQYPEIDTEDWDKILALNLTIDDPAYWTNRSLLEEQVGLHGYTGAFDNYTLDAIVLPSAWAYMVPSFLGTPVISVPLGAAPDDTPVQENRRGTLNATAPNQPFGIGFAGRAWSEEELIGMACAFEARTGIRQKIKPMVQPMTELKDVVSAQVEL
jgi:amidase